ncbi:unnamed protein product [Auanema sp. JU1783]|nr:unnamed protein product [Auanema sp. JU1783]
MEPNTLLVHVVGAKSLYLKNHSSIEALATITLQGKGSTKSRVQTEIVQTNGEVKWDEHCEFKLTDKSTTLVVAVQHKAKLGSPDLIGACEIPLEQYRLVTKPTWFLLKKKKNDAKYRGEVQIQLQFTYEKSNMSVSNLSLNKIEKEDMSVLSRMRRKIKKAKQKTSDDTSSIASGFSMYSTHSTKSKSSFFKGLSKSFGGGNKSTTLPVEASPASNSYQEREAEDNFDAPQFVSSSPYYNSRPLSATSAANVSNNGSSLSLALQAAPVAHSTPMYSSMSPSLSKAGSFIRGNSIRSNASSGFGSGKQNNLKNLRDGDNSLSQRDLIAELDSLKLELQVKESQLRELQEYLDVILSRALTECPGILKGPVLQQKSKNRFFN